MLIDADPDEYFFRGHFLNNGLAGGKEAADEVYARIVQYLGAISIDIGSVDIVVRAFANFSALQSTCIKKGIMHPGTSVSLFAQGFTQRRALFDFVDVGPGKEQADSKIRGLCGLPNASGRNLLIKDLSGCLELFVNNLQCVHIIAAVTHDGGYAPFLSNFASNRSTCDRITLLEGGTMNPSIRDLQFSRDALQMDTVFEPRPHIIALPTQAPLMPWNNVSAAALMTGPSSAPPPKPHSESHTHTLVNDKAKAFAARLKPVRDQEGRRVDKRLDVDPDSDYLKALRKANLCGYYYLRGQCDGRCGKSHVTKALNAHEFDCLWYLKRESGQCYKLRKGKDCEDPLCIYGHHQT